jgi:hypothetical protein
MSFNSGSPSQIQPLSLGNVVSAGLRLYRSHLKSYLSLSAIAYLWVLVPVYGWAKYAATLSLISRLAFGELVNQPETVEGGRRFVNSRIWQFLVMNLLMFLIGIALALVLIIPLSVLFGIIIGFTAVSSGSGTTSNPGIILLVGLLTLLLIPLFFIALMWVLARFFLVEVPLAVEDNVDATSTISRSWDLTKGHAWRIIGILFVGYLITLPIQLPFTILSVIIRGILQSLAEENSAYLLLSSLCSLVLSLLSGTLIVPFWQAIKAVIYYDLRSRREGLGLKLRDYEV